MMIRQSTRQTRATWKRAVELTFSNQTASFVSNKNSSYNRGESSRKPPQVERAIRIQSQEKKRNQLMEKLAADQPERQGEQYPRRRKSDLTNGRNAKIKAKGVTVDGGEEDNFSVRRNDTFGKSRRGSSRGSAGTEKYSNRKQHDQDKKDQWGVYGRALNTPGYKDGSSDYPPYKRNQQGDAFRQIRFETSAQLMELLKDASLSREEAFTEGQKLFDTVSNVEKREGRLYNGMIRLALRAQKRQKAIDDMTEVRRI
jgi:hypothetical protein